MAGVGLAAMIVQGGLARPIAARAIGFFVYGFAHRGLDILHGHSLQGVLGTDGAGNAGVHYGSNCAKLSENAIRIPFS